MKDFLKVCLGLCLVALLVMVAGGIAVVLFTPKKYSSNVTMEVRPYTPGALDTSTPVPEPADDPRFIQAQFAVLESREILFRVIDALELTKAYARPGQTLSREEAYAQLRNAMRLQERFHPGRIDVSVSDRDPLQAAKIANTIAEVFQEKSNEKANLELSQIGADVENQHQKAEAAKKVAAQIQARYLITDSDVREDHSTIGFAEGPTSDTLTSESGKAKIAEYLAAKKLRNEALDTLEEKLVKSPGKKAPPERLPVSIWGKAEPATHPQNVLFDLLQRVTH